MDAKELKNLSAEELRAKIAEARQEHLTMRFQHATAQLDKTSKLKAGRRDIARLLTILKEKE